MNKSSHVELQSRFRYGLILPKSKQGPAVQKAASSNVFGDDSDDEHSKTNIEDMIKKESKRNLNRLETQVVMDTRFLSSILNGKAVLQVLIHEFLQLAMQKALEEDSNVFEYDEIYDDMKAKKEEQDIANKVITKDRKVITPHRGITS